MIVQGPEVTIKKIGMLFRIFLYTLFFLILVFVLYTYKNPDNQFMNFISGKLSHIIQTRKESVASKKYQKDYDYIFACKKDSDCIRYVSGTIKCSEIYSEAGTTKYLENLKQKNTVYKVCERRMVCEVPTIVPLGIKYGEDRCRSGTFTEPRCNNNRCQIEEVN